MGEIVEDVLDGGHGGELDRSSFIAPKAARLQDALKVEPKNDDG
jgi:hypothetical protein